MSEALRELAVQYAAAFQEYLSQADEAALQRAYELGHDAMTRGLQILDLAAIHHEALLPALHGTSTPDEKAHAAAAAANFFMESLSPFEMTHRGFLEANTTLRQLNQTLEQQVVELKAAHAATEAAEQRSRFLAEAIVRLDAALDYDARLAMVARLAVPALADCCLVDVVEENGELRRAEVAAADPAMEALLRELPRPLLLDTNPSEGVAQVLETGRPEVWASVADRLPEMLAPDDEQRRRLQQLPLQSAMIVPMPARGRTIAVITLLTAESGRRYGSEELALAEDLARRAAINLDNARLYHEVQEAGRRKDEFLAMVAHELRNPLAAVANAARMLQRENPTMRERACEVIERRVSHLIQLTDDLLDVSRITRGKVELQFEPLDLAALVRAGVEDQRLVLAAASLSLVTELDEGPLWVNGDPTRLAQVLDNLFANAIKFSEPGGQVRVGLRCWVSGVGSGMENPTPDTQHPPASRLPAPNTAVLTVSDTGIGIDPAKLPGIFDPFTQADRSLDSSRGGLGLGLSVVKALVELHGGEVAAYSAGLGRGTEFTIRLPVSSEAESRGEAPENLR